MSKDVELVRTYYKRIYEELSDVQVAEMNSALHGTLVGRTRTIVLDEKTNALHQEILKNVKGFEYMELGDKIHSLLERDTKYVKAFHVKVQGKK